MALGTFCKKLGGIKDEGWFLGTLCDPFLANPSYILLSIILFKKREKKVPMVPSWIHR